MRCWASSLEWIFMTESQSYFQMKPFSMNIFVMIQRYAQNNLAEIYSMSLELGAWTMKCIKWVHHCSYAYFIRLNLQIFFSVLIHYAHHLIVQGMAKAFKFALDQKTIARFGMKYCCAFNIVSFSEYPSN